MWLQMNTLFFVCVHMKKFAKVAVLGGGSFGTALGYAAAKNAEQVVILTRKEDVSGLLGTLTSLGCKIHQ